MPVCQKNKRRIIIRRNQENDRRVAQTVAGVNRRWRGQFRCPGSRRDSAVAQPLSYAAARKTSMSRHTPTGREATEAEIREVERVLSLTPLQQRGHPSAVPANHSQLSHINTYESLPEFYLDQPFTCRKCSKREIWKARDQQWYYEVAKGHIEARALECHDCRTAKKKLRDDHGAA